MLEKDDSLRRILTFYFVAAIAVPLFYALYTNHIWEDFLITFKHSKNLVEGHGLVFQPGERIHGFTSPFNTLIPALFYAVTSKASFMPALWMYRILCIFLFAGAGCLVLRHLVRDQKFGLLPPLLFAVYYLLEIKSVAFTTNGQESAFMLLFVGLLLILLHRGVRQNWMLGGLTWAGLMYTRPDGCVYIAIFSLVGFIFSGEEKKAEFIALLKAGALCTALYLPWFIWVWIYYGSPVPHSVIAKSSLSMYSSWTSSDPVSLVRGLFHHFPIVVAYPLEPINAFFGGWPKWVHVFALFGGLFCTVYWLIPTEDRLGRMVSLIFLLLCIYLSYVNMTSYAAVWYFPQVAMIALIILSRGFIVIARTFFARKIVLRGAYAINAFILLAIVLIFGNSVQQIRVQQREIEFGNRKLIGDWIRDNVPKGETVYVEPLGYIGYYSQAKMLDFPGLASPEVLKVRRETKLDFIGLIPVLDPDWLVLRGNEIKMADQRLKDFQKNYDLAKAFDVRSVIEQHRNLMGIVYLFNDSQFYVLKRKRPKPAGSTDVPSE